MNDFDCVFNPKSVAIIGASTDPNSWGNWLAEEVIEFKNQRKIYFVNPNAGTIFEETCLDSVYQIQGELDLAVIAVPSDQVEQVVSQTLDRGVKAIIIISAGFGELNPQGSRIEQRIAQSCQRSNVILIGPNCAGVYSKEFCCLPIGKFKSGNVAMVSQSGGIVVDVSERFDRLGLGFSKIVCIGNQTQTSFEHVLPYLEKDPDTEIIALYVENTDSIPCITVSKPVVILSATPTMAAKQAAKQHTNSSLKNSNYVVNSISSFVSMIQMKLYGKKAKGHKLAILTDTGGVGVLLCSLAERNRLEVTKYVDLVGIPSAFCSRTCEELKQVVELKDVDIIIMNLHLYNEAYDETNGAVELANIIKSSSKPVIVSCRSFENLGIQVFLRNHIPVCRDIETSIEMAKQICGL